jgi:dihydroorotase-like cyclic amidohydrolase
LAIHHGWIVAEDRDDAMPDAQETIEAAGLHVLAGIVDSHVHVRDPGWTDREDWFTGTQAGAAGGVTTILEMPFSSPPVHSAAILQDRAVGVQPRSIIDLRAKWWVRLVGGMGEAALTR